MRQDDFTTMSGVPLEPVYGPHDGEFPGLYPYTRGAHASMYRSRLWTMRMFAGFGTATDTNSRFKEIIRSGGTGLSTAFDMPTLLGLDSDDPMALGEVGRCGVAIDSLADMRDLFAQRHRVVRVEAQQRGHVKGGREPRAAGADDLLEAAVRVRRGAKAREHAHGPQSRSVHRRVRAARVGIESREFALVGSVDRFQGDARHGREVVLADAGGIEQTPPALVRTFRCHVGTSWGRSALSVQHTVSR